ncbi:MAG: lytic transglycosylase domain-containing protein [Succinivibrio sp.]|nr:lytic transglycosylase domain-containing protein [Succinivibrio sp.]
MAILGSATYALELEVEEAYVQAVPFDAEPTVEYRINSMDVYKLSKYAVMLRRNHMVTIATAPKTRKGISKQAANWRSFIVTASDSNLIPPELIQAVIETESSNVVDAVSVCGAQGLMQLMPETQKDLGVVDPFDPEQNIDAGSRYLASLLYRYEGDLDKALAAYNAGPGRVNEYQGIPPFAETQDFVRKVKSRYQQLQKMSIY